MSIFDTLFYRIYIKRLSSKRAFLSFFRYIRVYEKYDIIIIHRKGINNIASKIYIKQIAFLSFFRYIRVYEKYGNLIIYQKSISV